MHSLFVPTHKPEHKIVCGLKADQEVLVFVIARTGKNK